MEQGKMDSKSGGGLGRFMSVRKREKDGSSPHRRQKSRDKSSDRKNRQSISENVFSIFKGDPQKKISKEQPSSREKIEIMRQRLAERNYIEVDEDQISFALGSQNAKGDVDKAVELVVLFQDAADSIIRPYDPKITMLGAVNKGDVTCYLDALLFGMYGILESFEVILHRQFDDERRRRLATLLRLWINMLRSGWLIETDITSHLQNAIAACGWEEAVSEEQQDTSLFFNWLAETLELPLLTLKSDTYHEGKEDAAYDHKVVEERLLVLAIPESSNGSPIRLENCLETYFNNQIEVDRVERSNTIIEKGEDAHVELAEVTESAPGTPIVQAPQTPISPLSTRHRTNSLLYRYTISKDSDPTYSPAQPEVVAARSLPSPHKGSISKEVEVRLPAFQFLNLIPWFSQHPTHVGDEEISKYLKDTRPTLGIQLKRYAVVNGEIVRKDTEVDIPIDIRLPHFIEDDDRADAESPLVRNFTLSLQSVICHRGADLNSGHYVCFIRGAAEAAVGDSRSSRRLSTGSQPPDYAIEQWFKHDDLAEPRVTMVPHIEQALKEEMPYLLFYQVQPIYEPSQSLDREPPAYSPRLDVHISQSSPQLGYEPENSFLDGITDHSVPASRRSVEMERPRRSVNLPEDRRGIVTFMENGSEILKQSNGVSEEWRGSVTFNESNLGSTATSVRPPDITSTPATPIEETTSQRLSRAASMFRNGSRSRPTSSSGESRISLTLSRLAQRSREPLVRRESDQTSTPPVIADSSASVAMADGSADAHETVASGATTPAKETTSKNVDTPIPKSSSKVKKPSKGKEPEAESESAKIGYHHHHHDKHKFKDGKDARECEVM